MRSWLIPERRLRRKIQHGIDGVVNSLRVNPEIKVGTYTVHRRTYTGGAGSSFYLVRTRETLIIHGPVRVASTASCIEIERFYPIH